MKSSTRRRGAATGFPDASPRAGFALITVVLLMIGMAFLATGLLFATGQQAILVASSHDVLRARHAADAAVGALLADWNSAARSLDPIGEPVTLIDADLEPGVRMAGRAERLHAEYFLLTATGTVQRGGLPPIAQRSARVVRAIDAFDIGRSLDAAAIVTHASLADWSELRGDEAGAQPGDSAAAALCAAWTVSGGALRAHPDSLYASPDAELVGHPPLLADEDAGRFGVGIGFLEREDLVAAARPIETPGPSSGSNGADACFPVPADQRQTSEPCGAWPLLHAPADLVLDGGYRQGVLLVDGDLVLDGAVIVRGMIMVRGTVTIRNARVEGVVIAPRLRMEGGVVSLDRCAVASALAGAPFLRAAHPPSRSWLPAFD